MLSKLLKATVFISGKNWDRNLSVSRAKSHVFPHHYVFAEFIHHNLIHKDFSIISSDHYVWQIIVISIL